MKVRFFTYMLVVFALLMGWLTMGNAEGSLGPKIAPTGESEVKLLPSDGVGADGFGGDVSVSGDVAVVGALTRGFKIFASGAAYVYRLNGRTWQEQAKLTASDGTAEDEFGDSVSVSGDVVLVGAARANEDLSGAAYVYRWDGTTWQEQAKLLASDGAAGAGFGASVAVDGDVALVGARGKIYVFRKSGTQWSEEAILIPDESTQFYGGTLSLSGEVAVIGVSVDNENGDNSGAVYVYRFSAQNGWQQEQKLVANDGSAEQRFGGAVSVRGDLLIVGANRDNESGINSGSAYVFRKNLDNQWLQEQKLMASDAAAFDFFGSSVSIDGQLALVGSLGNQSGKGYVYRFADNSWQEQAKLRASDASEFNLFASALSLSGSIALIGAPQQDDQVAGAGVGAAYMYNLAAKNESEITLNPTSLRTVMAADKSISDTLSIGNGGTETLNWSFSDLPSWLTATPSQGTLAPDGQQSVTIMFSQNVQLTSYTDTLTITSNDPDEATLQVPISLKVIPPERKLFDSEPAQGDGFGSSLSVDGDVLLVGIPSDDFNAKGAGSALAYRWNGERWQQQQKLGSNDPRRSDAFGSAVSIRGNVALVGDPNDNQNGDFSGAAYVFRWEESLSIWRGEAKLVASDGALFHQFGATVSVYGDWAIIGAPNSNGITSGSAYLFHWNGTTWQEEAILTSDGEQLNNFGTSVAMNADVALVGTPVEGEFGYVYVYRRDGKTWQREAKLSPNNATQFDQFGATVSLSGDVALIGAYGYESSSGAAYLFRFDFDRNNWQQEAKLLPNDQNSPKHFGRSVSIVGEMALVGAQNDNENGIVSGAAYLFRQNGKNWQQDSKIVATDGAPQDYFGTSVALSLPSERSSRTVEPNQVRQPVLPFEFLPQPINQTWTQRPLPPEMALIGAFGDDDHGEGSGSLYQYDLSFSVPEISLSPANLSVALVEGTSRNETVTMHNNSNQTISWQCAPSCGRHASVAGSSWLNLTPTSGTLAANQSQALTVQLNASQLATGHYSDTLTITSDASESPNMQMRIDLTVTPPESQLRASNGAAGHEFGQAVSMSGNYALIGATPDAFDSPWAGAAYLYRWNGRRWQEERTIVASDGAAGDAFGRAVGVSGRLMVIGAPFDDDKGENAGAAYLYVGDGTNWSETKVTASDAAAGDHFGLSVSIQGEFAFVGAPFDDNRGENSGAVYVFRFNSSNGQWEEQNKLLASDNADSFDYFGSSVNVSAQTALIGAVGEQHDDSDSNGAAYIYRFNGTTWQQEQKLVASRGGNFAGATSLAPNVALIANASDNHNGSAYFFRFNGSSWVEEAFFSGNDAGVDAFGSSLAISGNQALIGAKEEENGRGAVMSYRWDGSTWQQESLLKATDRAEEDKFGTSAAMSGEMALIGAPKEDQQGENSGAAYFYDLSIDEIQLVASEGSQGIDLNWNIIQPLDGDVAFYNVYRSVGKEGEVSLLKFTVASQYTDIPPAQTAGVEYCYHIEAVNSPQEIMIGDSNLACVRYGMQELFLPIVIR